MTKTPTVTARFVLAVLYLVLAIAGLIGTWYFNLQFFASDSRLDYLQAWFANPASSSAAVDIIVVACAGCVFIAVESWRLRIWWAWVLIPLSFVLAVAFALPLFLAIRELVLARQRPTTRA
jgi:Terpene cyclase DEP1